jgi:hypothetical protein
MVNRRIIYLLCLFFFILFGCAPVKQASQTIVPSITPIPGWHMLENAGFQIWLPENFVGGSNSDINTVLPQLSQKGPSYAKIAQSLQQRGTPYIVFAVDTDSKPDKVTYLLVGNEKLTAQLVISAYLNLLAKNLVAQTSLFQIVQKEVIPSDRYPTGKIVVELNTLESGDIKQVVYAEKNGGAVWQVSFTTPVEEFDQRSPVFDQIARSTNLPFTKEPPVQRGQLDPGVIILIVVIIIIFGLAAAAYIRRRQKPEPIQPKKTAKKKKTKK